MEAHIWVVWGRCWSKNIQQKYTCLEEIGLCTQNWMAILGPTSMIIRETQHREGHITTLTQHFSWQSQLSLHRFNGVIGSMHTQLMVAIQPLSFQPKWLNHILHWCWMNYELHVEQPNKRDQTLKKNYVSTQIQHRPLVYVHVEMQYGLKTKLPRIVVLTCVYEIQARWSGKPS